jgi:hypothetical protein
MSLEQQVHWRGWGRWTLFIVAALLLILSVPLVLENSAAAGWNIFFGLLLFGAVASDTAQAPAIAFTLAALFLLRSVVALSSGAGLFAGGIEAGLALAVGAAAFDLRRQRMSV